jgi:ribonuclease III
MAVQGSSPFKKPLRFPYAQFIESAMPALSEHTIKKRVKTSHAADQSAHRREKLRTLEATLGHVFKTIDILDEALTHRSFIHEVRGAAVRHNERLEFLGDAVLELVISHLLMEAYPQFSEGVLSKIRAALVNQKSLAERAMAIDLGGYLLLGRGEEHCDGRQKASLLSDAYEAVLGAIYLDGSYAKVFKVIKSQFEEVFAKVGEEGFLKDYKTQLQEKIQVQFRTVPRYELKTATGPDHDKVFEVELWVNKRKLASGVGKSKKTAEQAAAYEGLKQFHAESSE